MKALIFLIIFTLPLFLQAQISLNEWSTIKPVTDSSHHNRNACLKSSYNSTLLFWDQQVDATSTRLCYKNIADPTAETNILIEQAGVHLKHPKVLELSVGTSDSDFAVFYESNDGNDIDMKYIIYKPDGTQSDPAILSNLEGNDINLSIDPNSLKITWENTNNIYASIFQPLTGTFSQPACIEQNGGYSPIISNDEVSYLMPNMDSTLLISKRIFEYQGNWIVTDSSSTSFDGQCSGLNSGSPFWGMNKCMQQDITGEKSGIIAFDEWMGPSFFRSEFFNYTDPVICDYMIGVKGDMFFVSYVSDEFTQHEIFAGISYFGTLSEQNISQWPGEDKNPAFFVSFPASYLIRVHLFWESEREGYSTIYSSYYDYLFGGKDEKPRPDNLSAAPSPFDKETTITFQSAERADVYIFDLQGREIRSIISQKDVNGWQRAVWDGTNNNGNEVPPGSYIVVANSGKAQQSRIIIKTSY